MYLNLFDNIDDLKKEFDIICSADDVKISINVIWLGNICIPSQNGEEKITAMFKQMTCDDFFNIEKDTEYIIKFKNYEYEEHDIQDMKTLYIQRCLKSWSLPIELEFDKNNWITEECMNKIKKLPSPLIYALIYKYEESIHVDASEEKNIEKQSTRLFGKHSRGVENACEAISLFCTLGNFWDKFGLNKFDLKKLSYKDYIRLRMVIAKENHHVSAQRNTGPSGSRAQISTGGKTRASKAKVMPDTFQDVNR